MFEFLDPTGTDEGLGLCGQPVIKPQAGDVMKICCVVRNKGKVVNQRDGADHQVRRRNGEAFAKLGFGSEPAYHRRVLAAHLTKSCCTGMIKIQHAHVVQQISDFLEQRCRIINVVGAGIKLRQNDGRNK